MLMLSLTLLSCRGTGGTETGNSIYYWRTAFSLSDKEKDFLKEHVVNKIYIKFFDVSSGYGATDGEAVVPEATIRFNDSVPDGIEVVPTVYITNEAMETMQVKEDEYAERILKRVNAICRKNGITFRELQLDCDWTKGTRNPYYKLCEAVKHRLDSTQRLSSTIRLHQLTQTPPPVDRGVLMVYNTGNMMEMTTDNSIFSQRDIRPYLKDNMLAKYQLPLDVAYPTYSWSLVYRPKEEGYCFDRIMQRTDFSSFPQLEQIRDNMYEAKEDVDFESKHNYENMLFKGYRIRVERPSVKEIMKVKELIDDQLSEKQYNNILYHLDEEQLSHYSDHEISKIYSRN